MDSSRLTLLTQVNNQLDYGDCYPYQQYSPYIDYSHSCNNWYSSQTDHLPSSSSPSCSSSSSIVGTNVSYSSYGVSSFSPFLSSSLIDVTDYSVTYGSGIGSSSSGGSNGGGGSGNGNGSGIGSCGNGISPFPIDDYSQIMSSTPSGNGHFTWDNINSPINYHHQQACWNFGLTATYENEQIDWKPVILPVMNSLSSEYDCSSLQMVNRRHDSYLNEHVQPYCIDESISSSTLTSKPAQLQLSLPPPTTPLSSSQQQPPPQQPPLSSTTTSKSRRKKKDQVDYVLLDVNSAGDEKTEFIKYVGKGSYKCQICDIYSKNNKDYIQDHINIKHYNIKKNYECLLCHITFAWRSGAFKHLKKYHSIEGKNTINFFRAISKRHVYHSQRKRK